MTPYWLTYVDIAPTDLDVNSLFLKEWIALSGLDLSHFLAHLTHFCPTSVPLTKMSFHGVITSPNTSDPLVPLVPPVYYTLYVSCLEIL